MHIAFSLPLSFSLARPPCLRVNDFPASLSRSIVFTLPRSFLPCSRLPQLINVRKSQLTKIDAYSCRTWIQKQQQQQIARCGLRERYRNNGRGISVNLYLIKVVHANAEKMDEDEDVPCWHVCGKYLQVKVGGNSQRQHCVDNSTTFFFRTHTTRTTNILPVTFVAFPLEWCSQIKIHDRHKSNGEKCG